MPEATGVTEPTSGREDILADGIGIVRAGGTPLALPERALLGGLPKLARELVPFPPNVRGSRPNPSSVLELRGPGGIDMGDVKSLEDIMLQISSLHELGEENLKRHTKMG